MPPFCLQNPEKSFKNPILRGIKILIVFCFDFESILAPFWKPSWSHVAHQDAPKTPQDAAETRPSRPRTPQDSAKTPQEAPREPKTPPRSIFGGFLIDFWSIFDWFLMDFWLIFHWFLIAFFMYFGSIFHSLPYFWIDFWISASQISTRYPCLEERTVAGTRLAALKI